MPASVVLPPRGRALVVAVSLALAAAMPSAHAAPAGLAAVAVDEVDPSPVGRYIVTFEEAGIAGYRGGVPGLQRTAPVDYPLATRKVDVLSPAARSYAAWLGTQRALHVARIEQALSRRLELPHQYAVTRNGLSTQLSLDEANRIARLPGVRSVQPVQVLQTQTHRGPTFIGADTVWDGSALPDIAQATRGEGIRIGIVDTGVDGAHPSFTDTATCGFGGAQPKLVAHDCTTSNGTACVGSVPAPNPGFGHGMHVASTAAGNSIDHTAVPKPLLPPDWRMSGVAPCATVVSYKACESDGCYSDALEAAVQSAVADQVDVINYSIGPQCGRGNPWIDTPSFREAAASDILVVAAAGNTSGNCPDPTGLVSNLSPWVTTVAASSHDAYVSTELSVTGPVTPPALLEDVVLLPGSSTQSPALTEDLADAPLVLAPGDLLACSTTGTIPAGHFDGAIAIVQRGVCNFSEKIINAAAAGAEMVVIVNDVVDGFSMDTTGAPSDIASFSVSSLPVSTALIEFAGRDFSQSTAPEAVFSADFEAPLPAFADYHRALERHPQPDVIGSFSLRGPVSSPMENLPKPDITAPGVDIYAALDPASGDYGLMSGTSMASPHVAGAGALLRGVHPDWGVDEIKSAMMTTASIPGTLEDGGTPWTPEEVGSGRIDLTQAARAGLTLQETDANYMAANPMGGTLALQDLNLPALRNLRCGEQCSWTRTMRNRLDATGTWTVTADDPTGYSLAAEPSQFTLAPDESIEITITATISDVTLPAELSFGRVWLEETSDLSPEQHLPVAVRGDARSVECTANGNCRLRIDNFLGSYSALGCGPSCALVWANRFSPPTDVFPLTITSVTFLTGSSTYSAAGDRYDIYVYQDDDRDPTNGATLAGSHKGYALPNAMAGLRTVTLATPIVVDGPGDVVIAMTNPSNTGPMPIGGEVSDFKNRSYVGSYAGEDPDLASEDVGLALLPEAMESNANFILRASATTASGARTTLGADPLPERAQR